MVSFVDRQLFGKYVSPIQFTILSQLSRFIYEGLSSHRHSPFHETEILLNANRRSFISSDIYVLDSIVLHETMERS